MIQDGNACGTCHPNECVGHNNDPINPNHYKTESGIECIQVTELFSFCLGNAIKYAWRTGKKDEIDQELKKTEWFLKRALENGEDIIFANPTQSVYKARRIFRKLSKTDLAPLNYAIIGFILAGHLELALTHIDDYFVGER